VKLCNIAKVGMSSTIAILGQSKISGVLSLPGDKSISHRIAMLASVAAGTSIITGFASSADCAATLNCLSGIGVPIERAGGRIVIRGGGLGGDYSCPRSNGGVVRLDAANSGSTIRMLSGLLAAQPITSIIDGDESLRRRPMGRIIGPLRSMGARIEAANGDFAPLRISGGKLTAITCESPVASAQVKSCVLLAGLYAEGRTVFTEPTLSRNHTELMLREFGAQIETGYLGNSCSTAIEGNRELNPVEYQVPGDLSSASFFIAAAAMLPGSQLIIRDVSLNPTRAAFLEVLDLLGASIRGENVRTRSGELVGDLVVTGSRLRTGERGLLISGAMIPNLIDEIPILAVLATRTSGRIEVREARELRVKESDRIHSVVQGLVGMGGVIEEFDDGFAIQGPQELAGGRVETFGDHRIAMAFSIAGLAASGVTEILGAECAAVSLPEFYELLQTVAGEAAVSREE
jgi:3-phosphoshikimate 1-carboxyvinyltransferase